MKFEHLTFHPHPLAEELPAIRELIADNRKLRFLRDYARIAETAIQARVTFANGWTVSVITADVRPGAEGMDHIFYANKQANTYEVLAFGPDESQHGPFAWQTRAEVEAILARVAGDPG